ncbi:MAG: hypothetical protein V1754_06885 [Pseudomonadota bacterium]
MSSITKHKAIVMGLVLILVGLWGCSDEGIVDAPKSDSGPSDLFACEIPGQPCNAHDPCAIDPICGNDFLCRPSSMQNCNDKLDCTDDICLGSGLCENTPQPDWCALPVTVEGKTELQCKKTDDRDPNDVCQKCDPETDKTKWTPANGGTCNDENDCTKDDYCQNGTCKGTYFGDICSDELTCTDDICDGTGGCLGNPLRNNSCLIGQECYTDGDKDSSGCNVCDVAKSQNAWTPLTFHCLIDGYCFKPNEKDDTGCSICDPSKNPNGWTPLPGLCKIDGQCYQAGQKNTGSCAECDPTVSATKWTVKGQFCFIDDTCYTPNDKDDTECGICEPAKSTSAWTPIANKCLINGFCYIPGALHPTGNCAKCEPSKNAKAWTTTGTGCLIADGCEAAQAQDPTQCGTCNPAKSTSAWTPIANKCLIGPVCYADQDNEGGTHNCLVCDYSEDPNVWTPAATGTNVHFYDFELGTAPTGWVLTGQAGAHVGWQVSTVRSAGGNFSLYYGDPAIQTFDSGSKNSGTTTIPAITFPAGKKGGLRFWLYMDTESGTGYDLLTVHVNGQTIWTKDGPDDYPPEPGDNISMQEWQEIFIDLSTYAGQSITIQFAFDSMDAVSNSGEGVFIDDITVYNGC